MTTTSKENNVPWRIAFTRKDLLAAAWGSKKGADLLYHFIHRASWEAKNQKLADNLNDIKVQSSLTKALESASISRGCYHTYLKLFVEVGYVSMEPYGKDLTVHLAAIKSAFTSTPEKPTNEEDKPKQPRTKRYKLNDCTFVSLPAEEFEKMQEERFKMNEMVQSLNDSVAKLNLLVQSLNQNPSIYSTPEARLRAIFDSRYALEYRDDSDFFGEQINGTDQDQKPALPEKNLPDLDVLCEDMGFTPFTSANHSYSQDILTSTTDSSRLQENKAHQSIDILTSQESVTLPAKPAPIAEYKPEPPAPRLQTPAQIAQERKRIERHIWQLIDTAAGAKIGRSYTKPMEDLVTGYMDGEYLDEDFGQAVLLTKEKKQQLKFTNIIDNMADAVLKRKKIIDFQQAATNKKTIDDQIEESRRAAREFEANERARKEQGKVFA